MLTELSDRCKSSDVEAEARERSIARCAAMIACARPVSGFNGSETMGFLRLSFTDAADFERRMR